SINPCPCWLIPRFFQGGKLCPDPTHVIGINQPLAALVLVAERDADKSSGAIQNRSTGKAGAGIARKNEIGRRAAAGALLDLLDHPGGDAQLAALTLAISGDALAHDRRGGLRRLVAGRAKEQQVV